MEGIAARLIEDGAWHRGAVIDIAFRQAFGGFALQPTLHWEVLDKGAVEHRPSAALNAYALDDHLVLSLAYALSVERLKRNHEGMLQLGL